MPSHPPSPTEPPAASDPSPPVETPTELYFGYSADVPDLTTVDVKTVAPATLAGEPAVLTVIGESHYVGLPAFDFHELCSCKPLPHERTHETPLSVGAEREFSFESDRLDARTVVEGRPLGDFPGPDDATVAYRFDPDAWTTIRVGDGGYETYHTYPECDLALYTETTMTPKREAQR
ncbi:hypothetical protein C5B90_15670 [Haloferax sp. Atlit-12N]|uniref:DUF2617 family protein n=1 Tax=Haloferax sp. Atlit-12N TaxID=2077203 RepID=UPI000E263E1D|nr:DUF2617 family protein [Haloferax sp. Atlit-12N]RDZ62608.1 hypothetical protein C5B90_15670 [Haloferax sp. Atlit-12N]